MIHPLHGLSYPPLRVPYSLAHRPLIPHLVCRFVALSYSQIPKRHDLLPSVIPIRGPHSLVSLPLILTGYAVIPPNIYDSPIAWTLISPIKGPLFAGS